MLLELEYQWEIIRNIEKIFILDFWKWKINKSDLRNIELEIEIKEWNSESSEYWIIELRS